MIHRACPARPWADIALAGIAVNLAVLFIVPFARPDLNVFEQPLSYYAKGPWGTLQSIGFAAMGVASIALAAALTRTGIGTVWTAICVASLTLAGIAASGLVVFPMSAPGPTTFIGDAHMTAGTIGASFQLVAALAFTIAIWNRPRWTDFRIFGVAVVFVSLIGAIATQIEIWRPELNIPMGATIRLVVTPLALFWGVVGLQLRKDCVR